MGQSTLPKNAIIELRDRGRWKLYQITEAHSTWHSGIDEACIPAGTTIFRCVWKKHNGAHNLEVRKVRTKLTAATKTVAQAEAEARAWLDDQMRKQTEAKAKFDAVVARCDPNDPGAIMTALLRAALEGKL